MGGASRGMIVELVFKAVGGVPRHAQ